MTNSIHPPVRPVFSRDEAMAIARRMLELAHADTASVRLDHRTQGVTRLNRLRSTASEDAETVTLSLDTSYGARSSVMLTTNQLDDATLKVVVPYLEQMARARLGRDRSLFKGIADRGPKQHLPVQLWHEPTIQALLDARTEKLGAMLTVADKSDVKTAIFVGASAHSMCVMHTDGVSAYGQETDSEVTVTCWDKKTGASGWGGSASRDWSKIDTNKPVQDALDIARRSTSIEALEPGRRTAILGPAAVAQLVARMLYAFHANKTRAQQVTPFSKPPAASRVGERVFDPRITMRSDPNDPEGGYFPFFYDNGGDQGMPLNPVQWVTKGVLEHLAYDPHYGAQSGIKDVAETPRSMRLESAGSTATLEEMIASCKTGVYVNRLSSVSMVHEKSGLMTGVTRDGCFLVKDGKITKALKNFRFAESPWFMLNQLEMIGVAKRTAMGYTLPQPPFNEEWPLQPIIVPPLMVRDFNFIALADAV